MSFLPSSLSRAWGYNSLYNILPRRNRQSRMVHRDSVTSLHPEYTNLPNGQSDVIDEDQSPKVQQIASSAIMSISNTLRSKARMFYIDQAKAEIDMPDNTAAETSAVRPSSTSHTSVSSLDDSHKEYQKYLVLTASSPVGYKEISFRSNANSPKLSPVDDEYTDDGGLTYLGPFHFESFDRRNLDFITNDDCNPGPCEDESSANESSYHEPFNFVFNSQAPDCKSFDFSFYDGSGATDPVSWDLGPLEGSHSTYNMSELSETSSRSISREENVLATSYKACQDYLPNSERSSSSHSEGSSSSRSGSLSTDAQLPLVEARSTSHSQYAVMKSMEDVDTCSEHQSDQMTELARFPDYLKHRATDDRETTHKIGLPIIETQSFGQDRYDPERPFNAAKLPRFNASLSGNHVATPTIEAELNRWMLPPSAIPPHYRHHLRTHEFHRL